MILNNLQKIYINFLEKLRMTAIKWSQLKKFKTKELAEQLMID